MSQQIHLIHDYFCLRCYSNYQSADSGGYENTGLQQRNMYEVIRQDGENETSFGGYESLGLEQPITYEVIRQNGDNQTSSSSFLTTAAAPTSSVHDQHYVNLRGQQSAQVCTRTSQFTLCRAGSKPDYTLFGKNVRPSHKFSDTNVQKLTMNNSVTTVPAVLLLLPDLRYGFQNSQYVVKRALSPKNVVLHQVNF